MSNIEYQTESNIQIECRISNIKLNPTFKSNVEYRISNSISHSNRMSNIEYQTNPTFKFWMSNIENQTESNIQILNIEYQTESNIQSVNVLIHGCCSIYNQLLTMTNFEKLRGRWSLTRHVVWPIAWLPYGYMYICTTQIQHADRADNVWF